MSQAELDFASEKQSVEHPFGNDRLFIVKTILETFQSHLDIESSFKTGTTFTFKVLAMPSLNMHLNISALQKSLFP